jgi:hypothetical protein
MLTGQRLDLVVQLGNTGQQRPDLRDTSGRDRGFSFQQGISVFEVSREQYVLPKQEPAFSIH